MKRNVADYLGKEFGKWTVIGDIENIQGRILVLCQCSCQKKTIRKVLLDSLLGNKSKSCGCSKGGHNREDLTKYVGTAFGRWNVIGIGERDRHDKATLICECSCEKKTVKSVGLGELKKGASSSCGCYRKELLSNDIDEHIGKQFGKWIILATSSNKWGHRVFKCQCSCESKTISYIQPSYILTGKSTNCGCNHKIQGIVGQKYGRLTILEEVGKDNLGKRRVLAECDCDGNIKEYTLEGLRSGNTKSCNCYQKDVVKETRTFQKKDYEEKYPFFCKIEEIIDDPDGYGILVRCKKCNEWFKPIGNQVWSRVVALENPYGFGENNLYCSDECKNSCPLYNLQSDPFKNSDNSKLSSYELSIWREQVLLNQFDGHGYNFCEYCHGTEKLTAHHIEPKKLVPFYALDPDNGLVACSECHYKYGHSDECSTGALANVICNK